MIETFFKWVYLVFVSFGGGGVGYALASIPALVVARRTQDFHRTAESVRGTIAPTPPLGCLFVSVCGIWIPAGMLWSFLKGGESRSFDLYLRNGDVAFDSRLFNSYLVGLFVGVLLRFAWEFTYLYQHQRRYTGRPLMPLVFGLAVAARMFHWIDYPWTIVIIVGCVGGAVAAQSVKALVLR
jgi:hypothetical protein